MRVNLYISDMNDSYVTMAHLFSDDSAKKNFNRSMILIMYL